MLHGQATATCRAGEAVSAFSYIRGHEITTVGSCTDLADWRWAGTGEPARSGERACTSCGRVSEDGCDPCLGRLPGVKAACCGHGKNEAYVLFDDGSGIEGAAALDFQRLMSERNMP